MSLGARFLDVLLKHHVIKMKWQSTRTLVRILAATSLLNNSVHRSHLNDDEIAAMLVQRWRKFRENKVTIFYVQ